MDRDQLRHLPDRQPAARLERVPRALDGRQRQPLRRQGAVPGRLPRYLPRWRYQRRYAHPAGRRVAVHRRAQVHRGRPHHPPAGRVPGRLPQRSRGRRDHHQGRARGQIDTRKYNAVGLRSTDFNDGDNELVIGGDPVQAEYQPCAEVLVFNHLFDGAIDPISGCLGSAFGAEPGALYAEPAATGDPTGDRAVPGLQRVRAAPVDQHQRSSACSTGRSRASTPRSRSVPSGALPSTARWPDRRA